ncbi:MAG: KH domain-containing protein [Deltaproteobacteria bacterium]|nr:KH domain-containing protein [Deltaproteobacteria bacterium]
MATDEPIDDLEQRVIDLVTFVAKALVDETKEVEVYEVEPDRENVRIFELRVARGDLGKVIGRGGTTARALRQLVTASTAGEGARVLLDIVED